MKKFLSMVFAALMLTASLSACGDSGGSSGENGNGGASANDGKVYTLQAAYAVAEDSNSQHTIKFNTFKELVEEKTDGHVIIEIHPGGELGTEQEYIEMLQNGELAFTNVASSVVSGFTDAITFADCPFLFRDQAQVIEFVHSDVCAARLEQLKDIGLIGLGLSSVGDRNFLTVADKPITCLADMKGLKLRTMQTAIQVEAVGLLGAQATPLSYNECYQSMQTNVINGMENEVDTYLAMRFYEVAPNYTKAGWLQLIHAFLASKEIMDSLPVEYQEIILEAANDISTEKGIEYAKGPAADKLAEVGANVIEITDNSEFKQALIDGGLFEKYNDLIGQDVIDWVDQN
ncbi:MAG: TRAP transporter substrate-binding protein [Oscillibacter sp.]|jgi:tripartite ATP-independent transporter DctP family solute receptor|nr:TRAP transporter substrate-binding protein [Oscillibacter sp.]